MANILKNQTYLKYFFLYNTYNWIVTIKWQSHNFYLHGKNRMIILNMQHGNYYHVIMGTRPIFKEMGYITM